METDILFADADETLRVVYHDYFSRKGFAMQAVVNKWECAEQVVTCRPFFLIVDVELFTEDSEQTLLSGAEAFQHVPVVIVTGDEPRDRLAELTGVPVSRCFRKPYSFVTLLKCMCESAASTAVAPKHNIECMAKLIGSHAGQASVEPAEVSLI